MDQADPKFRIKNGRIKQSIMGWTFNPMPTPELAKLCREVGLVAMEGIYVNSRFDVESSTYGGGDGGNGGAVVVNKRQRTCYWDVDDILVWLYLQCIFINIARFIFWSVISVAGVCEIFMQICC